jgi:hypothetical protein
MEQMDEQKWSEADQLDRYRIAGDAREVTLWTRQRLPFEPKGWLKQMRDGLRKALLQLDAADAQQLYMKYSAAGSDRFDLEHVLTYNVGAGAFRRLAPSVLLMERSLSKPAAEEEGTSTASFPIRQEY